MLDMSNGSKNMIRYSIFKKANLRIFAHAYMRGTTRTENVKNVNIS
jgi:hypothetical protein